MDKETNLAIICLGVLPFIGGGVIGYFLHGFTSYKLFLYALIHPLCLIIIMWFAAYSAEKDSEKDMVK